MFLKVWLLILILSVMLLSGCATRQVRWIPPDERTPRGVVHSEAEFLTKSLHPSRVIVLLADPASGSVEAVSSSRGGSMLSREASLREALQCRFDPGAVLEPFSLKELRAVGVTDITSVSALDLARLYGAIANGGILRPENRRIIPSDQIECRRKDLLDLVQGKRNAIILARVDGMNVAGAAGHGGKDPVTACFSGYFPANHPRHVCMVVIEGADVILKHQRGGLLAAPVFSSIAAKIVSLEKINSTNTNTH